MVKMYILLTYIKHIENRKKLPIYRHWEGFCLFAVPITKSLSRCEPLVLVHTSPVILLSLLTSKAGADFSQLDTRVYT